MSNVDPIELSKFSALADTWWDCKGQFKSLHDINPLRVDLVEREANGLFDKNVLDIGCGGGILSEALAKKGANVTGLDMVESSLNVAKLHAVEERLNINYVLSTAEDWANSYSEQYDVVCCLEMLEHVPDPISVIGAAAKMVKPDGLVVFSTLNRNVKSYLMAIVGAEYVLNMVPKGTHDFNKFITPFEMCSMVEQTELTTERLTGLHYSPFRKQYYLGSTNVDVNYFLICRKLTSQS